MSFTFLPYVVDLECPIGVFATLYWKVRFLNEIYILGKYSFKEELDAKWLILPCVDKLIFFLKMQSIMIVSKETLLNPDTKVSYSRGFSLLFSRHFV